jgi:plastocyanin
MRRSITGFKRTLLAAVAIAALAAAVACKGSSPTSATPPGGGGGTPPPAGGGGSTTTTAMAINASGVLTPNDITVPVGSRVTIVNQHNRPHEMNSDPHPEHSDCPPINDVGFLNPGQTKLTGNLNTVRTCGLHDHNDPDNRNLTGIIRIQ